MKKTIIPIRTKLLFLILPIAIIPLTIIVFSSSLKIYYHLENKNWQFYSTLLKEVKNNIDVAYNNYLDKISAIYELPAVKKGLEAPPYKNKQEENDVNEQIIGSEKARSGGVFEIFGSKIDGALLIYELDRFSTITGESYKIHSTNSNILSPNFTKLIQDPLYYKISSNNTIKNVFGKLQKGVIPGLYSDDKPVIIFPYYSKQPEKSTDTFTKFILMLLNTDFISKFYENIEPLKYGTLYILDENNNIISVNHPSKDDYYEYNIATKKYILNDDNPNDKEELLNFKDYQMLNTDKYILKDYQVRKILDLLTPEGINKIYNNPNQKENIFSNKIYITFNNEKFLTIAQYAEQTQTKYLYFLPIKQIQKPIFEVISVILIISMIIIILIIMISYLFSKIFTNPIRLLADAATEIAQGKYGIEIDIQTRDEIEHLGNTFKYMVTQLNKSFTEIIELNKSYIRFVPEEFLKQLDKKSVLEINLGDQIQKDMAIMFSDIREFTELSETMTPKENFNFLNSYLKRVGPIIRKNQGFIDKYIGDAIMALFPNNIEDSIKASIEMQEEIKNYNQHRKNNNYKPISVGIGIHNGSLMLGTIGEHQRMEGTVISDAVNLASRLEGLTKVYGSKIIITEQILLQLKNFSLYHNRFLDKVKVKGKKNAVEIFEIYNNDDEQTREIKDKTKIRFLEAYSLYLQGWIEEAKKIFLEILEQNKNDQVILLYLKRCDIFLEYGLPKNWDGTNNIDEK